MSLPKFESHHLDLHIWSYKIHKTASKQELKELAFESAVTDAWDPCVSRPHSSVTQNRGDGVRRRGGGLARRRRGLRRHRGHLRALRDEVSRLVLLARPMVQRRWLVTGEGSTVELRHEAPMTTSLGYLIQARYELHEVTTVLPKQREEDEKASVVVGRGELRSGEAQPWSRQRKNRQWPSPRARMARLSGR